MEARAAAAILRSALASNGWIVANDQGQVESALRLQSSATTDEIAALTAASRAGIPAFLVQLAPGDFNASVVNARVEAMETECGVSRDLARWAIVAWALALEVLPEPGGSGVGSSASAKAMVQRTQPIVASAQSGPAGGIEFRRFLGMGLMLLSSFVAGALCLSYFAGTRPFQRAAGNRGAIVSPAHQVATENPEQLTEILAEENEKLETLPAGPAGLQSGVAWFREFESRFKGTNNPRVQKLRETFVDKRAQLLASAQPALAKMIDQAQTPEQVDVVLQTYVPLPSDQRSPFVATLEEIARVREETLQKTTVASQESNASEQRLATSAADDPANRPPTEHEMYLAIRALYDNYNENSRNVEAACRNGQERNDPILALQCIGIFGATAGRGGLRASLSDFRKIGCAKADERPGYICDFSATLDMPGTAMTPSMRGLMQNGQGEKRFVWDGHRWLAL